MSYTVSMRCFFASAFFCRVVVVYDVCRYASVSVYAPRFFVAACCLRVAAAAMPFMLRHENARSAPCRLRAAFAATTATLILLQLPLYLCAICARGDARCAKIERGAMRCSSAAAI